MHVTIRIRWSSCVPILKATALVGGVLLLSLGASAQDFSAGVVGGTSLTDGFQDLTFFSFVPSPEPGSPLSVVSIRYWSPSKDYVAGGMLEVHFNPRWSLEVNGLFRQLSGKWATVLQDGSLHNISPHPVVTWEFPVLAKYRFQRPNFTPFVEAGPSFRTAGNLNSSDPSHHGLTAGTGLEFRWRSLKIAPTVRYTLWAGDKFQDNAARTAPDQVEFLVRFSRESESTWHPLGRRVSVGFTVGANLTGDYRTRNIAHESQTPIYLSSGPRSFIYGPKVEFQLPHRLSVEVNALHRPISQATETTHDGNPFRLTSRSVTWVFPVLAKYRFSVRGVEPFIALGPSFRLRQTFAEAADASPYGVTAAAGLEMQVGFMKIAPAIRYTHWAPDRRDFGGPYRNQAEALLGVSF